MSNANENVKEEPTQEDWQQLGSLEAQAWTVTPPGGGAPMSLNDYAANANQENQTNEGDDPDYEEYKKYAAEENAARA